MNEAGHDYAALLAAARSPADVLTLAFAGVIALAPKRRAPYDAPIADLDDAAISELQRRFFSGLRRPIASAMVPLPAESRFDEFGDLVALLLDHRTHLDDTSYWLSHAIATACTGGNHLWQDMGLPGRGELSQLMKIYFTSLALMNTGDMKWKKFFYRQLCERAGLNVCRAPSCGVCGDYDHCFGPEESASPHAVQA